MPPAIVKLMEQIDSRIMRERVLIFLTLLAVVFLCWQLLVQSSIDAEHKRLVLAEASVQKERKALETTISTLTLAMASSPALAKQKTMGELNASIAAVEGRLAGLSQGLISAQQLPKVLEEVLVRTAAIKLLQLRTLPVSELQLATPLPMAAAEGANNTDSAKPKATGTGVYKHSVLIRVSGSYAQVVKLLQDVEALPWKFYWESLNYTVTTYPNAEIEIQVFTLSSEEGLLGV